MNSLGSRTVTVSVDVDHTEVADHSRAEVHVDRKGPEPDEPFDGRTELTIDTSCIVSPSTGRPSKSVRISAESHAPRYAEDHTGWT